jgi:hypothetical protein
MRRAITAADRAVNGLLRQQGDLITRSQVLAAGVSSAALRRRLRTDGPWKTVLPGIYLAHNGSLTAGQREIAAVLYAGRGCVITGQAAVQRQGIWAPRSDVIDVLIPATEGRRSNGFVQVHRTTRMPDPAKVIDGLRWAPPVRAVGDAARGQIELRDVRALVANAVQRGTCTVQQLAAELQAGPKQGSWSLRAALEEVADGVASVAEGDLRALIKKGGLAEPMYNPRLYIGSDFLAQPDAWWPDAGVAGEVDSREYHFSPADWEKTMARHARMSAQGIIVLHFTPRRIRTDAAGVVSELRASIEVGLRRQPLPIRAVPTNR